MRESVGIDLTRPRFQFRDGHFKVIFFAPEDMLKLKSQSTRPFFEVTDTVLETLNTTQKSIIRIMLEKREVRVMELAEELDLSRPAIQKAIKRMLDMRLVTKSGKARDTSYHLSEEPAE